MNPAYAAGKHYARLEEELQRCPVCAECGDRIVDDFCFEVNDEPICSVCMYDNHRKLTENFMDY